MEYINQSRSNRSQEAIDGHEVPIALLNANTIDDFLYDYGSDYSKE